MATLQLIWPDGITSDQLCAWDRGQLHQSARVAKNIQRNIYVAELGPVSEPPSNKIVVKIAYGEEKVGLLEHEYTYYTTLLAPLQGTVIPICYGLFKGKIKDRKMGCLLLEHIKAHTDKQVNVDEFHRQLMVAICKIHQAGLKHGNLKSSHILQMGYSPRIIDFSLAEEHRCEQAHPANLYGRRVMTYGVCDELSQLEVFHGVDPNGIVMQQMKGNRDLHRMTLSGDSHAPVRHPSVRFDDDEHLPDRGETRTRSAAHYPVTPYPFDEIRFAKNEDAQMRSPGSVFGRRPNVPPSLDMRGTSQNPGPSQVLHPRVRNPYSVNYGAMRGGYIYRF